MEACSVMELKVEGINKTFMNNGKEHQVLEDISFEVEKGQFISLLGPSGCGKTTLLTIIAGFKKADSGSIMVKTKKLQRLDQIEALFQNHTLSLMTVKENILFLMKQIKMVKPERENRLKHLLKISQ